MTDRHSGYIVTLVNDVREDDAEATVAALRQIKGVLDVQPLIADPTTAIAEVRAKAKLREYLSALLEGLGPR